MMISLRTLVALMLCTVAAEAGTAHSPPPSAEEIVAAAKRATGGARWDKPQGCIERGSHADGAVTYLTRFSLRNYGIRTDGDRDGKTRSMGFDGKARWQAAGAAQAEIGTAPASLREAITTNYLSINGFFFPKRFPADFKYVRSATEGERRYDVLEVTPRGGRTLEVWFDRLTHLIQRVVDTQGAPAVRVEASDYRRGADGLMVAYRLDVFGPDGSVIDRGTVASFQCGLINPSIFAPPIPC